MLFWSMLAASVLFRSPAFANPSQYITTYPNSTITAAPTISLPSFAAASCALDCTYWYISRTSQYWSKYITAVTLATVVVVINDSEDKTTTVTNYVNSLLINGTAPTNSLPPRTDTNAAGTVTQKIRVLGSSAVFTYPTPYYDIYPNYSFSGVIPFSSGGGVTCVSKTMTDMPLPSHTPWPTNTGSVDPEDSFGWSYKMQDEVLVPLGPSWVATEFPGQFVDSVFQFCTPGPMTLVAPMVKAVSYLTETSTAHVSNPISSSFSSHSADTNVAEMASTSISLQPTSQLSTPLFLNPTPTKPPAAIDTVDRSSATLTSSLSAKILISNSGSVIEGPPAISASARPVTPMSSGSYEFSSMSTQGLLPVAELSSVRIAGDQHSVSGMAHHPQKGQTRSAFVTSTAPAAIIVSGSKAYAAGQEFTSGYVFGTQTLLPGGPVITVSNTPISLPAQTRPETSGAPVAVVVPDTTAYLTVPELTSGYVSVTQTLVPGGIAIIVSGTQISLPIEAVPQSSSNALASVTAAGELFTGSANSISTYGVGTQTLVPGGPAITLSGIQISLASNGAEVVIATGNQVQAQTTDIGGYIMSGLGGSALATSSSLNSSPSTPQIPPESDTARDRNSALMNGQGSASASRNGSNTEMSNLPAFTGAARHIGRVGTPPWWLLLAFCSIWGVL